MTRVRRQQLGPLILLLSGCPTESTSPAPGGSSTAPPDDPACADVECAALAGVCQEARCDASAGGCRISAAREGEPCLEGNPCGASECRSGECVPLAPPPCAELFDDCRTGICRPDSGCVAEPRDLPGTREDNAVLLSARGVGQVTASSTCQEQPFAPTSCTEGLTGPSAIFELDLRDATELTRAHFVVDAPFAVEAALTRGPRADPAVLGCAEPFYADGQSRRLSAELEPGRYHLLVTGRSEADRGPISVASVVGDPGGAEPPPNDDCATPLVLDGALEQQTIIPVTVGAAQQMTPRCAELSAADVFYELDLSRRSADVMLDIDVGHLDGFSFPGISLLAMGSETCTDIVTCGEAWSRRVSPGIYKLALHVEPREAREKLGIRVRTTDASCLTTTNDRAETALELDPSLATQRLQGNTACGNDDSSTACSEDRGAPDLFYRLDLRQHTAPQTLFIGGEYASGLRNYVLVSSGDAEGLRPTRCADAGVGFVLAPRLYYLVFDGAAQSAGRFDLELELSDEYTVPRDCLPSPDAPYDCLLDSEPACSVSMAHPDCMRAAIDCGLASDVYATFCTAQPGCCDGTDPTASCEGPWRAVSDCNP